MKPKFNHSIEFYLKDYPQPIKKSLLKKINQIISENNTIAQILTSSEYKKLVKALRQSLPDIFSGEISCVDGRIPSIITHLPKITRTWKEPGSVAVSSNFPNQLPARLASAIDSHFYSYPKKHLVEFIQAHTSLSHQTDHGCGATKLALGGSGIDFDSDGGLAWNIRQLMETTISALENQTTNYKYLTAVLEVLNTDNNSLIYGLDKFSQTALSQETITNLINNKEAISSDYVYIKFKAILSKLVNKKPYPNNIWKTANILDTYKSLIKLTGKLLNNEEIHTFTISRLNNIYPEYPKQIIEFIAYRLMHNLSVGIISGIFNKPQLNPFHEHQEEYISIGEVGIGDDVVSKQGFRVTHASFNQIIDDIIIMLDLMKKIGHASPPYIIFGVRPINKKLYLEDPYQQTLQRDRAMSLGLKRKIYAHPVLSQRLINKDFVFIPCLVEEKNQEILEIPVFN